MTQPLNPLAEIDRLLDPLFQKLNQLRQAWDAIDPSIQMWVPSVLTAPMLGVFAIVETIDRSIGIAREKGLLPPRHDLTAPNE